MTERSGGSLCAGSSLRRADGSCASHSPTPAALLRHCSARANRRSRDIGNHRPPDCRPSWTVRCRFDRHVMSRCRSRSRAIVKTPSCRAYDRRETSLLNDQGPGQQDCQNVALAVLLAANRQYTYTELLNAVYEQNRLDAAGDRLRLAVGEQVGLWDQNVAVVTAVYENGALLWPAIREIIESDIDHSDRRNERECDEGASRPPRSLRFTGGRCSKDIDFWMF